MDSEKALGKLKNRIDIAYYISPEEMKCITDACHKASSKPVVKPVVKKVVKKAVTDVR